VQTDAGKVLASPKKMSARFAVAGFYPLCGVFRFMTLPASGTIFHDSEGALPKGLYSR